MNIDTQKLSRFVTMLTKQRIQTLTGYFSNRPSFSATAEKALRQRENTLADNLTTMEELEYLRQTYEALDEINFLQKRKKN